jgi:SAM-dependent methyltransferase
MTLTSHWDRQYREGDPVWDVGHPTGEVERTLAECPVPPGRALELGCGTGANAVWLARRGFRVAGIDLSPTAIDHARRHARGCGVDVRFLVGDLREPARLGEPYEFFLDCGCFGAVQLGDRDGYLRSLRKLTRSGAVGLVLTGNADEPEDDEGPPVLTGGQLREAFGGFCEVVRLRPFRFDAARGAGQRYLGWSCLLRRK